MSVMSEVERAYMPTAEEVRRNYEELTLMVDLDDRRAAGAVKPREEPPVVAWLIHGNPFQGGEYYRAYRPAVFANHRWGWGTAICDRGGEVSGSRRIHFQIANSSGNIVNPDVIIARGIRMTETAGGQDWAAEWVDIAHAAGQRVIADLDDDLWAHEDWPEDERPNDDAYESWCWKADGWLVSTERIAERIRAKGAEHWNGREVPVLVAPNCYDFYGINEGRLDLPTPGRTLGNRLWISGRMTPDLELWRDDVAPLLEEMDLRFVHVGADERLDAAVLEGGDRYRGATRFTSWGMPQDRLISRASVPIPLLGKQMAGVNIGVIVQGDHAYNRAKTETNGVELGAIGIPVVAHTDHYLYDECPGRVPLAAGLAGVRERIVELLEPDTWHREAAKMSAWAKAIAERSEAKYLDALQTMVARVRSGSDPSSD